MKCLNRITLLLSFTAVVSGCSAPNETIKMQMDDGRPLPIRFTDETAIDTTTSVSQDILKASVAEEASHEFGGVTGITPILVSAVAPVWPSTVSHHDTAKVFLKCLIDTTGKVEMASVVKSNDSRFNRAALRSVMQSKYKWPPHNSIGPVWHVMPFTFREQ